MHELKGLMVIDVYFANPRRLLYLFFGLVLLSACGPHDPAPATQKRETPTGASEDETLLHESWGLILLQGKRAGYLHSRSVRIIEAGHAQVRHSQVMQLSVQRSGQPLELTLRVATTCNLDGRIQNFRSEVPLGPTPTRRQGHIRGDEVLFQTIRGATVTPGRAAWSSDIGGFGAVERSLVAEPMQAGQRRQLRLLQAPPLDLVGRVDLVAETVETTKLLAGEFSLLKIRQLSALPEGGTLETILWANEQGEVLKTETPTTGEVTYRVPREVALAPADDQPLDLERDLSVVLDRPLARGHGTQRAVYELAIPDDDPVKRFPNTQRQQIESLDSHRARLTIVATGPERPTSDGDNPPTEAEREASALIQSNDAEVVALANSIAPEADDSWSVVRALEETVHRLITKKDYSQVFASAADVVRTRQGDCTEHAVLLAALCRARKLSARVAIGLVYLGDRPRLAYHMWTEVWIDGGWQGFDATLGRGGLGAGHVKVADTPLSGASAYTSLLPVMRLVGRLEVRLVESE